MSLQRYRQKRNFEVSPEPRGRVAKRRGELQFVIQKHAASHLHYDFRLELDGVLLSWAVPKGPSLDPAAKRLAVHVEDHPLEYGGFEGTIPAQQYGAGTVMLWDQGTWEPKGNAAEGYAKGKLKFELHGAKLRGGWALIRTRGGKYGGNGKSPWLLIKERDAFARQGAAGNIVEEQPDSVASGRSIDAIANDRERVWHSNRSPAANVKAGAIDRPQARRAPVPAARPDAKVPGARKASLSQSLAPELATLVDAMPEGDDWLHEVKYDGYRMVCRVDRGKVRIFSRNGKEWTEALVSIAAAVARLPVTTAWLDGEVATLSDRGPTSFQLLQNALADPEVGSLVYFAFDLVHLDGYDLRAVPLLERKRLLRAIIPGDDATVRYGIETRGSGGEFFEQACELGLEGAISKRVDSTYQDGARTREWLKIKCGKRQELVIGGYTEPQGSRTGFGALLLGVYVPGGALRYSGRVGTGFDDKTLTLLHGKLAKLEQATSSFVNPPHGHAARGVHWVAPKLVAEVAFTEWTADGTLRHPSFQGLREDKQPTSVTREQAMTTPSASTTSRVQAARPAKRVAPKPLASSGDAVAGVTLSHPDKLLYPDAGLSKLLLARFYESVGERLVPHLRRRPLSLVRCPDGWNAQCFYQKHADKSVNPAVDRVTVPEGKSTAIYMSANSVTAVVALLQWGVLELHPWGSCVPRLDRPDRLIFDFDPDEKVAWKELVAAATLTRTLLDDLGLQGFLKTTGGKGLHVVVPIRPTLDWNGAKEFTRSSAELLVRAFPDRFTASLSKEQRKRRIFIDYLRNAAGATAISPYSLRARANAPVAMPIAWEELAKDVRFDYFNVSNVPARLAKQTKDPWADFFAVRQTVTRAMLKKIGAMTVGGTQAGGRSK